MGTIKVKLAIGFLVSVFFIYLAFRKVDFGEMYQAFETTNYCYLLPAVGVIFFGHYLRALRWRYLLDPIRRLDTGSLFSSLTIGYMANMLMPAHLGEILRTYILSKKKGGSMGSTFATIVVERIIDMFSLLVLMSLAIFIYPFPVWIVKGGYIMFATTVALFFILIFLRGLDSQLKLILRFILSPFPKLLEHRIESAMDKFISGISPLKRWHDYIAVAFLSVLIWACYGLVFYFCLHAFDFVEMFDLTWSASLILLVITTVSIVVPSSPGYVGTYHYLSQISLAMFGVPPGPALSFAAVVHGIIFLPVFVVGLFLAQHEGVAISRISEKEGLTGNVVETA